MTFPKSKDTCRRCWCVYCGNVIDIPDIFIERAQAYPVREFNVTMSGQVINLTERLAWHKDRYECIFPSFSPGKEPEAVEELKAITKLLKAEFGNKLFPMDPEKLEVQSLEWVEQELAQEFLKAGSRRNYTK